MHGHPEQVNHDRHHDKSAAHPHDGRQDAHQAAQKKRHDRGEHDARLVETGLPRHGVKQPGIRRFLVSDGHGFGRAGRPQSLQALLEHVHAHKAQHDHIGDLDQEIGVAHRPQNLDDLNPAGAAQDSADQ